MKVKMPLMCHRDSDTMLKVAEHSIADKTSRETLKTLLKKDQYLNTQ